SAAQCAVLLRQGTARCARRACRHGRGKGGCVARRSSGRTEGGSRNARRTRQAPLLATRGTHMPDAFIYDHVRTPRGRGKADGSLHEVTALNLATQTLATLKDRNHLDSALVDDVVLG